MPLCPTQPAEREHSAIVGVPMLDFSRQFSDLREEILEAIAKVCDTQSFILGPQVGAFETAAAAACHTSYAVGCASGTDALWLAIAACGIGATTGEVEQSLPDVRTRQTTDSGTNFHGDDAVVTSPFSFFATASSILRAGARPVFADIDPRTFNLSPAAVAEAIASQTGLNVRAILPVHLYGQCADVDGLRKVQDAGQNIHLIEDAAQAFGAEWTTPGELPQPVGSLGDVSAFSFYPTKNLSAAGDAGLVTTSNDAFAAHMKSLRAHGMTRRYYHDELGWNSRLDSIQAAVLSVKLKYLPQWNAQRRALAARYNDLFQQANLGASSTDQGIVLPWTDPRATHVYHQYVIRTPRRDALRAHLTEHRIGSEIYYPLPLHLQAALSFLGYKVGDFPHAERAAAEVLALPMYPELRDEEQQTVVEAIRSFYA